MKLSDPELIDELRDLGCPEAIAPRVVRFMEQRMAETKGEAGAEVLGNLLRYFIDAANDSALRSRVIGVMWAFDLQHYANVASMAEHADLLGVSKEAISRATKRARAAILGDWETLKAQGDEEHPG